MVRHEIPIIVDSDPLTGALNISADGSQFEVTLDDPITIPSTATAVNVSVSESLIWWTIPNITNGVNSRFVIDNGGGPYDVNVPTGLYDLSSLQQSVESAVIAAGGPSNMFTFIADNATQKVVIRLNAVGITVTLTASDTFRDIIGFNSQVLGPTGNPLTDFPGDNVANFNQIDFFLIHSDIVANGIRVNNTYDQIIAQVLINVPPGSQILSSPFNPPKSPAPELAGSIRNRMRFRLTDQAGNAVNTNTESWSARMIIEYDD